MAQVILIEDHKSLHDLLSINLTTYVGAQVIPRENAADAIQLLKILPSVDLIITKAQVGDEKTANELLLYLQQTDNEIGLIILGDHRTDSEDAIVISDPRQWEDVIKASAKILGVTSDFKKKKILPDYVPIPINYFLSLPSSCCNVYIRIKRGPDEFQFIKRIHQGDSYHQSIITKYIQQGLTNFYITKEDQEEFTNFMSNQLVAQLEDKLLDDEERLELLAESYQIATQEIIKMGFNSATIQLTESIITSMLTAFEDSPNMATLLRKVLNSKASYTYQHAHMTSIVASECLNNLGQKDNHESHEKLAYAAFFHDITLVDDEELAKIMTFKQFESAKLSTSRWDKVMNHALDAAKLIREHHEAPLQVDEIIKHHHGSWEGKGFSQTQAEEFPLLSQIFIVAVEFSTELLSFKQSGGKPAPIIDELYKKYPGKKMVAVIGSLEKTLRKRLKK